MEMEKLLHSYQFRRGRRRGKHTITTTGPVRACIYSGTVSFGSGAEQLKVSTTGPLSTPTTDIGVDIFFRCLGPEAVIATQ
jgi:hypothetical protein